MTGTKTCPIWVWANMTQRCLWKSQSFRILFWTLYSVRKNRNLGQSMKRKRMRVRCNFSQISQSFRSKMILFTNYRTIKNWIKFKVIIKLTSNFREKLRAPILIPKETTQFSNLVILTKIFKFLANFYIRAIKDRTLEIPRLNWSQP